MVVKHGNLTPNPLRRTLTPGEDAVPLSRKAGEGNSVLQSDAGEGGPEKNGIVSSYPPHPFPVASIRMFPSSIRTPHTRGIFFAHL